MLLLTPAGDAYTWAEYQWIFQAAGARSQRVDVSQPFPGMRHHQLTSKAKLAIADDAKSAIPLLLVLDRDCCVVGNSVTH